MTCAACCAIRKSAMFIMPPIQIMSMPALRSSSKRSRRRGSTLRASSAAAWWLRALWTASGANTSIPSGRPRGAAACRSSPISKRACLSPWICSWRTTPASAAMSRAATASPTAMSASSASTMRTSIPASRASAAASSTTTPCATARAAMSASLAISPWITAMRRSAFAGARAACR